MEETADAAQETTELEQFKEVFRAYAWGNWDGQGDRGRLPSPPKLLGVHKSNNKEDGRDTRFSYGVALFAPLKWYLEQISWAPEKDEHEDAHP